MILESQHTWLILSTLEITQFPHAHTNVSIAIRCWDIATERCRNSFESKSDASLTTLTTAWDYDCNSGYSGLGPDIIVAGYGNGSLRVFDSRSSKGDPVLYINDSLNRHNFASRRRKYSEFDEHTSWIVDVSFTTYGGRNEVSIEVSCDFNTKACLS